MRDESQRLLGGCSTAQRIVFIFVPRKLRNKRPEPQSRHSTCIRNPCQQHLSLAIPSERQWSLGKIGGAGIMPGDDCIRRPLEARAEDVWEGVSSLQHDCAGHRLQPFPRVLPYSAHCRGPVDKSYPGPPPPVRFNFGLDEFAATRKPANCFRISGEAWAAGVEVGAGRLGGPPAGGPPAVERHHAT